jgi:hypothetical protein
VWGHVQRVVHDRLGYTLDDAERLDQLARSVVTPRRYWQIRRLADRPRSSWPDDVREYVDLMGAMLAALTEATGRDVLVDSGKSPTALAALGLIPDVDVAAVHIVRDARGVANSERRTRTWEGVDAALAPPGRGAFSSAVHWSAFNLLCRQASRRVPYVRVRYEEFGTRPKEVITGIAHLLGLQVGDLFVDETTVRLSESHIAAGNPSRFGRRERTVRTDDSWRRELPRALQAAVRMISLPAAGLLRPTDGGHSADRGRLETSGTAAGAAPAAVTFATNSHQERDFPATVRS